jgi:hypothetical protein
MEALGIGLAGCGLLATGGVGLTAKGDPLGNSTDFGGLGKGFAGTTGSTAGAVGLGNGLGMVATGAGTRRLVGVGLGGCGVCTGMTGTGGLAESGSGVFAGVIFTGCGFMGVGAAGAIATGWDGATGIVEGNGLGAVAIGVWTGTAVTARLLGSKREIALLSGTSLRSRRAAPSWPLGW